MNTNQHMVLLVLIQLLVGEQVLLVLIQLPVERQDDRRGARARVH